MAINFNKSSNPVKHIYLESKNQYVQELVYGSSVVWEEYVGVYSGGSLPTGVASLNCSRTSQDPAVSAGAISPGASLYNKDVLTFTATPTKYHVASVATSTYTVAAHDPNNTTTRTDNFERVSLSGVTAAPELASITLKAGTGIASFGYTYWAGDDSTTQKEGTFSGGFGALLSAWKGHAVKWFDITAASGYALLNSTYASGSLEAGFESQIVTVGKAYPYEWRDICSENSSGSASSSSSSVTNIWKPGGLAGYEKVRVSGTVTITLKSSSYGSTTVTKSFSNFQLAAPNSSATLCSWTGPSSYGSPPYGSITMYHSNALSCSAVLSYSGSAGYSISGLSVNVTNIQVYVPFDAEQFLDVWNEDTMQFSSNIYPGYVYAVGDIEGSSSDESLNFSSTSFTQAVSEQISSDTAYTVSLTEGAITAADAYFAVSLTKGGYMVTTMFNEAI